MTRSVLSTAFGVLGLVALLSALYAVQTAQAQATPPDKPEIKKVLEQPMATVRFERLKAVGAPYQAIPLQGAGRLAHGFLRQQRYYGPLVLS